jgi:MtN3 and saliva related transmembrane protein
MEIIGEALGYLAGICTAIVFLPQTIQTIKDRNVSGLSLSTYIIYCVGMVSWILYGIYLHSVQMMLFNSISLFFAAIILYLIVKNKHNSKN